MASTVWFVPTRDGQGRAAAPAAALAIFEAARVHERMEPGEFVAVKFHVGEVKNSTHVPPDLIKALVGRIKDRGAQPFLTETATLYRGERENAIKHIMHAASHGFGLEQVGAPFIMADGLVGDNEVEVPIEGVMFSSVSVAREARMADFLLTVSHMTGHLAAGFGCCLKNLGMGLASRKGKMRQHSSIKPEVVPDKCVLCRKCIQWCPEDAIAEVEGKADIDQAKCVGCGECLAVCRFGAVKYNWSTEAGEMQEAMAEHALGVLKGKKAFHLNYCVDMTVDCDCFTVDQRKVVPDVGLLGSFDPVALDQASLDLTRQADGRNLNAVAYPKVDGTAQLAHAERIHLGSRAYQLVKVE